MKDNKIQWLIDAHKAGKAVYEITYDKQKLLDDAKTKMHINYRPTYFNALDVRFDSSRRRQYIAIHTNIF